MTGDSTWDTQCHRYNVDESLPSRDSQTPQCWTSIFPPGLMQNALQTAARPVECTLRQQQEDGRLTDTCVESGSAREQDACAICLETFTGDTIVRILPCDHCFHDKCAVSWLCRRSSRCPVCREDYANLIGDVAKDDNGLASNVVLQELPQVYQQSNVRSHDSTCGSVSYLPFMNRSAG